MEFPKRPPYWNSTSGFDFDHITAAAQSTFHSVPVCKILSKLEHKKLLCRFLRWRISAILDFKGPIMGSLKSPCTNPYRSSIDTVALNCSVFEKIAFFCILATNGQMDTTDALSRSRFRERRLNKHFFRILFVATYRLESYAFSYDCYSKVG